MFKSRIYCLLAAVCVFAGCSGQQKAPVLGEAYAGPVTLKLRSELGPDSPAVATVKHGEKLEIIQRRRRFLKVRTPDNREGWTEMRQLLASEQMEDLNRLADLAQKLPSQGAASVYDPLNVHTEPNRSAPSFHQIKEGDLVDVVEHKLLQRVPFKSGDILPKPVRKPKARKKKESERVKRPEKPAGPPLPVNWVELSRSPVLETPKPVEEQEPPRPIPVDDWTLVRLKNGRAGWVLTRMLKMNIPDDVAQYSEGHRITSYFAMKEVQDEGQIRHHWLWTTIAKGQVPYQFDSFRYFIWNTRRHRYETAYVERNLKGYYPVMVHPVEMTIGKKRETFPGFTLILEDATGQKYRATYGYQYYLVKLVSKEPIEPAPAGEVDETLRLASYQPKLGGPSEKSMYGKFRDNVSALKQRWFGR